MEHPAFSEAGASPGIEIWTIDQFEPVPIDTKLYGKFYNGDSYIVLKTTGDDTSSLSHDAHFWLGSKTTQDKKGSAAIWTITLDDMLGGRAVHHREVQGHESSIFLGYFKPAIRYMEGGNESGFNEVTTNAGAEKRLLKLSGCDNMRIEEVPAEASSLSKDHCFILEVEHDIFVLMPESAKATQRRKIISVANTLRDDYHNGRATIEIIDEFSSHEDVNAFFEALGSGSKEDLADDSLSETFARDSTTVFLFKVLLGEDIDIVALNKPYKQKHLSTDEIYILDTPCSGIYLWIGAEVDPDTKKNYHDIAQKYIDIKGYPSWMHVTRVTEGAESSIFKQYFHNWDTVSSTSVIRGLSEIDGGYFSGDADESAATAKLIGKSAIARSYMPDQGDGQVTIIRVVGGDKLDITDQLEAGRSVLYQSEVYVITYAYTDDRGNDAHIVYWWIGSDATDDDKLIAYELVQETEEAESNVTVVRVPQGKECKHFLSLFKGNLAILFGTNDNEYKPENFNNNYDENNIRLFRVEGTELGVDMRAVQVQETSDVLEDDDVFVLETATTVYVRNGKESDPMEQEAALKAVELVMGAEKDISVVEQGEEPDEFWDALGGVPEEKEDASGWRLAVNRRVNSPPEMSAVTVSVTGKIKFEDLSTEYAQQDLSEDGVYILDTGEELYLWQGNNVPERVKMVRNDIVEEFIKDDGLDRTVDSAVVLFVKQGIEPAAFTKLFPSWEDDMWLNQVSYEDIKNELQAANS